MDTYSSDDFIKVVEQIREAWKRVAEAFSALWDEAGSVVENLAEILKEVVLYQPKQQFPRPPQSIIHKSYVTDKRSNIRQSRHFRR